MYDDYRRFLTVAQHGSISRAAEAMNVSQPALSRSIRLLEESYGTPLFERTHTGVSLTEAGKTLFLYASRAARAIDSAQEEIDHQNRNQRLTIRICAGDSWGYGILPPIIRNFMRDEPAVQFHVDLLEHDARLRGLNNHNYDVAFGVIAPESLESGRYLFECLVEAPYDIYCDKDHPLLRKSHVTHDDLLAYHWVNHKFEYDFDPSAALRTKRSFAIRCNSTLHAMETLVGTDMLLSTTKTAAPIFARHGILRLIEDHESPKFQSGTILEARSEPNSVTRRFLSRVKSHCQKDLDLSGRSHRLSGE